MYRNYIYFLCGLLVVLILNFTEPVFAEETGTGSVFDSLPAHDEVISEDVEVAPIETEPVPTENAPFADTADTPFESGTSFFMLFLQMIAALVVVIALIYIMLRFVSKRTRSFRDHQTMQSIGGVPLGTNRSLQMIKLGDRILVVGVGESIQLIKEIEDKDEIKKILAQQEFEFDRIEQPLNRASTWINQILSKKGQNDTNKKLDFSELLNKQLKDVSKSQKQIHEAMKEHKK
ncbi:hypothetical protein BTR23_05375 [Alkalihalophilus pseudofirmus]|nr:hypothetical protein BTR23_05375 [Alkalihalophilus pseudofirmus]